MSVNAARLFRKQDCHLVSVVHEAYRAAPDLDLEKPPILSNRGWSACLSNRMHSSCRFLPVQYWCK